MSEKLDVSYSLTEEEKRIFRKFKRSNSAKLTKSEFQTMLRSKLVDGGFGGEYYWFSNGSFDEGVACLSENGLRVKAAMRAEKKLSVRYWITTGVAIAGFRRPVSPHATWDNITTAAMMMERTPHKTVMICGGLVLNRYAFQLVSP